MLHDLIERHERVIASDGVLLQVTQVDVGGNKDLKRVLIISKGQIERNKQDQSRGDDYRSQRKCFTVYTNYSSQIHTSLDWHGTNTTAPTLGSLMTSCWLRQPGCL